LIVFHLSVSIPIQEEVSGHSGILRHFRSIEFCIVMCLNFCFVVYIFNSLTAMKS